VIEKAVAYLERDELPPHWDKEILFNMGEESTTESSESEEIDDEEDAESPEEKDHLVRYFIQNSLFLYCNILVYLLILFKAVLHL